jgi:hypothetical protein
MQPATFAASLTRRARHAVGRAVDATIARFIHPVQQDNCCQAVGATDKLADNKPK